MVKQDMINFLVEHNGEDEAKLKEQSYEEVKNLYTEIKAELGDDSTMFPNGRDTDAEDEDGV